MNGSDVPVVALRGIKKIYQMGDVEVQALCGVDLNIEQGEMVAIMGPSGSGKSTLMNIIGCLDVPSEGSFQIDGTDVSRLKDDDLAAIRCRKIGFVFQSFNLLPRTTALANVELPLIYAGISGRERHRRAQESLQMVGLGERQRHKPNELSGGQQQRVAIARALINRPSMILADEPTGNLDEASAASIHDLLDEMNARTGLTILLVTHSSRLAMRMPRRLNMVEGRLVDVSAEVSTAA